MKTIFFLSLTLWSLNSSAALTSFLSVGRVYNSKTNQNLTQSPQSDHCQIFKGTYQGNKLELIPRAYGGSGKYRHRIMWQLSDSYQTFDGQLTQHEVAVKNGSNYLFTIPQLKNDIPFVQQSVLLVTEDVNTKETATSHLMFNVSRPVILSQTSDPVKLRNNCFQVMPAIESVVGILTNGSTNPSQILIRHGVQNLWTRTRGSQWGFFISPLAWSGLANIFSAYKNYFTQYSRQTVETVEISSEHQIAPGDYLQIYEQRTRYVTVFDALEVDMCGDTRELDGSYFLQWWGVAYHAFPVNPYSPDRTPREAIGVAPMNSCPDALTPEFLDSDNEFIFARTN